MAIYRMLDGAAFDPELVQAMTAAYEETLRKLRLANRTDPITEIIASKIIEWAKGGERDPYRLCEAALQDIAGS